MRKAIVKSVDYITIRDIIQGKNKNPAMFYSHWLLVKDCIFLNYTTPRLLFLFFWSGNFFLIYNSHAIFEWYFLRGWETVHTFYQGISGNLKLKEEVIL